MAAVRTCDEATSAMVQVQEIRRSAASRLLAQLIPLCGGLASIQCVACRANASANLSSPVSR